MSSILTNNSAMVALQTMKKINMNMAQTQSEISTGKSVANAKDNAAVWAISKVMESDVKGFKGISDSLALGSSTVAVAREASETVTELLTEMKGKIVAAQEGNVDRGKIQTDVAKLREQIGSVVGAAQFNGLNLVNGTAGASVNVLSSLDRSASGVTASAISVTTQNLSIGGYAAKDVFADAATAATTTIVGAAGDTFTMSLDATTGTGAFTISGTEAAP
ncbi:MAG: flagellin, partial [Cypionkella sp.]